MRALNKFRRWISGAIIDQIHHSEDVIMQAIDEFVAQQTAYNEAISTALNGIAVDIESLNAKILELSSGPSDLDPADQALLDELLVASASLAQRVTALDEMTPPAPPVEPPVESA